MTTQVGVWGGFDNLRSRDARFLQEAARLGPLDVWLASDAALAAAGRTPRFREDERLYLVESIRWVRSVRVVSWPLASSPPVESTTAARRVCAREGIRYVVLSRQPKDGLPRRTSTELRASCGGAGSAN